MKHADSAGREVMSHQCDVVVFTGSDGFPGTKGDKGVKGVRGPLGPQVSSPQCAALISRMLDVDE